MTEEQTLPGLESAIQEMERNALQEDKVDQLPTYTAERVANYEPKRYELAARLLFTENISRRTICKWLHMSPNTLSAIEVRELRINPERVKQLKAEANAEIEQLKRMGREALRARFFDKNAMLKTSAKEIASILKILDELSNDSVPPSTSTNRNTDENEYVDAIAEWQEDGFEREKISAPETTNRQEAAAPATCSGHTESADKHAEPAEKEAGADGQ